MDLEISCQPPVFGENYKAGYIGFTFNNASILSYGIAHFTRWARMSDIRVSHALVVTGDNECVEALIDQGVKKQPLSKYFDDPARQIFFRKPAQLTAEIAASIVKLAKSQVGNQYDTSLLAAQVAQGTFIGKLINKIYNGKPDLLLSKLLNNDDRWICSELAAYCLDEQPEYMDKGILSRPNETIDPQELFEDASIFAAWKREASPDCRI